MSPLLPKVSRLKQTLDDLRGYLDFDRTGNEVVRRTDFSQCQRPVLLLYGFFATRRTFQVLERRLRRDGYGVWSINLGGLFDSFNTEGIDTLAEKVRDKVERMYARYPGMGPLTIIGHSKGGLIGRYYVKRLGGDRRVKNLVTLGTPHNGSPTAYLGCLAAGAFAKSVWQMTPMSPFIRRLKIGAFPRSVRFVSIYSKHDKVNPFPCCILEDNGTGNIFNVELTDEVTHRDFLLKRTVYDVVRRELSIGYGDEAAAAVPSSPLRLVSSDGR